jgi:succinoglycan biosynthesis transport protein ExoP
MSVASQSDLDLSALGTALWRKRWRILSPVLLVGLVTLLVVEVITPRYQSESRVIVEGRDNIYLRPDADKDTIDRTVDEEAVTSQVQLVLSRDLAAAVIDKLKLGQLPEFDPDLAGSSPIRSVLGLIGLSRNPMNMTPQERVLEAYYDRLTVYPVEKSRVIVIDFLSEDPELGAQVANAIAEGYLDLLSKVKQQQAQTAGQALSGEIESMRKKVMEAEAKVEAYRATSNLLVGTNNTTLSAQQLGDMNAQLAAARAQKADAEAKSQLIRDMIRSGQPVESSDILNSELIRRLSEQRVTLRAQLAEQSSSLLDNHPRIKELKAQIADLDHQITNEAALQARSLENDAKIAGTRVDSLTANLDQLKGQAALTNADDVQLRELERDAKSQRDLLESYLAKYREAMARDNIDSAPPDARVISRATVSNVPAYPKKLPAVLIAMLTTLVLAAGFVLTKELLAAPAGTAVAEPERQLSFGAVRKKAIPAPQGVDFPVATIDDVSRDFRHDGGADGGIAVFGAVREIDTSWTALKLARTLAGHGRVVLVGISPADAAIKAASNDPSASGLAELVAGTASFRDIIVKDRQSSLHLISSGHEPAERSEILAAPELATSFAALARSYDHVVVAAGAVSGDELEAIGAIVPHAILAAGRLSNAGITAARERLLDAGFDDVTVMVGEPGATAAAA